MSKQYDAIGASYNNVKNLPAARLERYNLAKVIKPYIQHHRKTHILDLACGLGYYSRLTVTWGAERVVGVDISEAMILAANDAKSALSVEDQDKLSFLAQDASKPSLLSGASFDVVMGNYFLNYAPDAKTMTEMFRNISLNLKEDGVFIGITPAPVDDLTAAKDQMVKGGGYPKLGIGVECLDEMEDGLKCRLTMKTEPEQVQFENYLLRKETYESCARLGGLVGELEWMSPKIPLGNEVSMQECGVSEAFWDGYEGAPHFAILVVKKQ